jgi:hypothetical protein
MAIDIDWVARLRTAPSPVCPSDKELRAFSEGPESVTAEAFSHIVSGCTVCRRKLQEIVLHPPLESLEEYARKPDDVPEDVVFHCMSCEICQGRVRGVLDG